MWSSSSSAASRRDRGDRGAARRGDSPCARADGSRRRCRWRAWPIKTLSGFDFSFQPSLDRNRILALAQLDFIDRHEVVHFIGQSGTGKSHLAAALGVEAVRAGRSVYFSPLADIIDTLPRPSAKAACASASAFSAARRC